MLSENGFYIAYNVALHYLGLTQSIFKHSK